MKKYSKKMLLAVLFIGTLGAMEQSADANLNLIIVGAIDEQSSEILDFQGVYPFTEAMIEIAIPQVYTVAELLREKDSLIREIGTFLEADNDVNVIFQRAPQFEARRKQMYELLSKGVVRLTLFAILNKSMSSSFERMWFELRAKYFGFLEELKRQSDCVSLGLRDEMRVRFNHALVLHQQINSLVVAPSFKMMLLEKSYQLLATIFNNLQ